MVFFVYAYWHDQRFKNRIGGPIKVFELADNLTGMGHTVFLFVPKIGFPERQTSASVQAVPFLDFPIIRFISSQVFAFVLSFCVLILKQRPQIIYVRLMSSFLPMLIAKLFSIPVILEINDSPHLRYKSVNNVFKRWLVRSIDRISYHLSDHILPVSAKIADDLHNIDQVPIKSMTVMQSGTNTRLFNPSQKDSCRKKIDFETSRFVVGFIGNFFSYQGIDILIDAAPLIIEEYENTKFLLVGDGPMDSIWRERVKIDGLEKYFLFTGHVPYREVPYYVAAMDVCIAPLLFNRGESSAVKVFDYMACGRPVIMSDIADTGKEFLESGAVILVKPGDPTELADAINSLLSDPDKRRVMGEKGRDFVVSKYDRKKLAKDIADLCLEIINRKAR